MSTMEETLKDILSKDSKLFEYQVQVTGENPFRRTVEQTRELMTKILTAKASIPEEVFAEIDKYLVVSPLGPLTSTVKGGQGEPGKPSSELKKGEPGAQGSSSRNSELKKELSHAHSACSCEMPTEPKKLKCASVTFEIVPVEDKLYFVIKELNNVLHFDDLPYVYKYGPVSFYLIERSQSNGMELCVRTRTRTKWFTVGSTKIDSADLKWMISTMKAGGNALTEAFAQIRKAQQKAGRTFDVVI
jgi:hypothetical protein